MMAVALPSFSATAEDPRTKLVLAALKLFADKGFEGASTREIADAAGANISAIRYYFGDKAGLYRAAFTEPCGDQPAQACADIDPDQPLDQALQAFFAAFLAPLKRGEEVRLVMKLHFREMIEPTGAWTEVIDSEIRPQHEMLVHMLAKRFETSPDDLEVKRLAVSVVGMAVHYFVGQEVINVLAPQLIANPAAIDLLATRLAFYAAAMIDAEGARRRAEGLWR